MIAPLAVPARLVGVLAIAAVILAILGLADCPGVRPQRPEREDPAAMPVARPTA